MAASSDPPATTSAAAPAALEPAPVPDAAAEADESKPAPLPNSSATSPSADGAPAVAAAAAATSSTVFDGTHDDHDGVNPLDFQGAVDSNNELPSAETLAKIENYVVLDRDGKSHTFKSLYAGKHTARRVLIIFVRHFFCGICQEYLRSLSASITPEALLRLPISTFIAVIGCGDPGLIEMYANETKCPFPIYSDPTRKLYSELGMIRTLAMGARPAYMTQNMIKSSIDSVFQGLKQIRRGLATKAGDARQIGGEFLFEPFDVQSPVTTPWYEVERRMGDFAISEKEKSNGTANGHHRVSETSLDGKNEAGDVGEQKHVTWCHRMKTTRDHAEIPELMEILGLDGQGMPIKDKKRWSRALEQRKGTGLSMASQMSAMKAEAGGVAPPTAADATGAA
ncbi:AhpC/TSA antioxidant enzyme-domain-containing protein [Lasiosphaeria ovina]|uniref:AhpC/TSA antioxidant enzyme-domain-containing protein n=1 Tax=Lasiosphaeria ovina TaxID=92902 RepID=A0AAE0JWK0_9PEZI|nr:AhpC/TSA antioxidant enzyme-domain-containing protein [Lasiosphaeria ovina]